MLMPIARILAVTAAALILAACDSAPQPTTSSPGNAADAPPPTATEASVPTITSTDGVAEATLANGMKVIVKEDHRAPVVVSQVWYKVGSSYEYGGLTGVSHVLEHMMFKGTSKHGPGEFSRIISENGGRENAFTGRDYTSYFQQLERSRLPIALELEADRMRNLLLSEDEYAKEVKVVMEERRLRTDDKPSAYTYEQFMATAFQASSYHNPVIGWTNDLENLRAADLKDWYRKWYAPNNATLVVVGDVDAKAVVEEAVKYFGKLSPSDLGSPKPRVEPPQKGMRRVVVEVPAELPVLYLGYKVPVLKTAGEPWKAYALEVLASVLDGGDSARLTRDLVRGRQIAASAGAGYDLYARQKTLLTLHGVPAQGHSIAELEQALREQVRNLQTDLVDAEELARIKAQVTAAKVYEQDSQFYQGMQIGMLETVGLDWREAERYVERVNEVTPEQIRQVANEFLQSHQLTVAELKPLSIKKQNGPARRGGHE